MKLTRQFSANQGQRSVGLSGPDAIEKDLDNINKMFDPDATHDNEESGGIGTENVQKSAITDELIGDRTIDQSISDDFTNTSKLTSLLSFLAKAIRAITGEANWYSAPVDTIKNLLKRIEDNDADIEGHKNTINDHETRLSGVESGKADKSNVYAKDESYSKSEVNSKVWGTPNIADESITPDKLSGEAKTIMSESVQTIMLNDHETRIVQNEAFNQRMDLLHVDSLPGTIHTPTYNSDGTIGKIVHAKDGAVLRTDTFTFSDILITEKRVMNTGESVEFRNHFDANGKYINTEVV